MKKLFTIGLLLLCQLVAIAQKSNTHTVTVVTNPAGVCQIDLYYSSSPISHSSLEVSVGQQVNIGLKIITTGFVIDSLVADGIQIAENFFGGYGYSKSWHFEMPDHDVTVTAYLHYTPDLPPNPNESGWDEQTGSITVNNFTPGKLLDAIRKALNPDLYQADLSKVKAITVVGTLQANDLDVIIERQMKNLVYFDISRTTGLTRFPNFYEGNTRETLTTLLLPATINNIGNTAFSNFESLRSITIYATTPPHLEWDKLEGVPAGAVFYVPAESLPLYAEAEGWKDFDLQPITQGVHKLTVSMPSGTDIKQYKDMVLELVNTQTAQTRRYVLTAQTQYTFTNLIENTQYNIYIKNAREDILGSILAIEINKSDVQVTFSNLEQPRDITLQLIAPSGAVEGAAITWTDALGNYLATGATLTGQMEGARVVAKVKLGQQLGTQYVQPADTLITVGSSSIIHCPLSILPQVELTGTVTAISTDLPIRSANIAVTQQLNGLYPKTFTTTTDAQGRWTLTAFDTPTEITAQANGYVPQVQTIPVLPPKGELEEVALADLTGTTVYLDPYFRPAVRTGEEMVSEDYFSGDTDISYTVYDETHQQELTNFVLQYPRIVLQGLDLEQGTRLRVTATSLTGLFAPSTTTCTVNADGEATATLPLIQFGQLISTFAQTDNMGVVGMLYDATGQQQGVYKYSETQLTITNIPDGNYILVTMGESRMFNGVNTLAALMEMRLEEGRDYVKNELSIQSGRIDSLHNQLIPMFDETLFSYTGENTSFSVNKSQVTVGNYVTLRAQVDFKDDLTLREAKLNFDLPDGCSLVEGSVMVGNQLGQYQEEGNRVIVPISTVGDQVCFCVMPTREGYYEPTASVNFNTGWVELTQPLGSVSLTAQALSIYVPQQSAGGILPVSGMAIANSSLQVYDDNVLIGQTVAGPAGNWQVTCALHNPYNLSEHPLHATCTTPEGLQLLSATTTVTINHGTLTPVVTMNFFPEAGHPSYLMWDFHNSTVSSPTYWARYVDKQFPVEFDIDFMNEDEVANDTALVSNVVLYVLLEDRTVQEFYPRYNTKKGCWHAAYNFDEYSMMPINVYVDFQQEQDILFDSQQKDDLMAEVEAHLAEGQQMAREIHAIFDEDPNFEGKEVFDELERLLAIEEPDEAIAARIDSLLVLAVGREALDNVVLEEQTEIDELNSLLAIPIEQATIETENRIAELIDLIMAVGQPDMSDLITRIDTLDAQRELWREQMLDMLAIAYMTDTTTLVKPDGDMAFDLRSDNLNKHYTTRKLDNVNAEELLAQGYEEYPTTDGHTIYFLTTDSLFSYVDTHDAILYTVELKDIDMAEARRAAPFPAKPLVLFDEKCRSTILEFELNWAKLAAQFELYSPTNDDFVNNLVTTGMGLLKGAVPTLECLWKSGLENITKGFIESVQKFTKEVKEKRWNAAQTSLNEATDDLAKATKQRSVRTALQRQLQERRIKLEGEHMIAMLASPERAKELENALAHNKQELGIVENALQDTYKWVAKATRTLSNAKAKVNFLKGIIKVADDACKLVKGCLDSLPRVINTFDKSHEVTKWLAKFGGTAIGALLQVYPLCCVVKEVIEDIGEWLKTYAAIKAKYPCKGNPGKWSLLYARTLSAIFTYANAGFTQIKLDVGSLALDVISITGVTPQWWISVIMDIGSVLHAVFRPGMSKNARNKLDAEIARLDCTENPTPPKPNNSLGYSVLHYYKTGDPFPESMETRPVRDPSGFVFEAVESNRLEGVKATCFYKETVEDQYGDLYENVVLWDAENYEQENPLFTDAEGKYRWDVPQGLWQVKYEKAGYETTYSDWLPVPPPQLEVNVGMTQLRQPAVQRVKAYPDGIDITFDKYMRPQTLTKENIFVTKNGQTIGGKIELLNAESGYQTSDSAYVSKVRFMPDNANLNVDDKVQLTVRKAVESYAGLQMEQDFTQQFDMEQRVTAIIADNIINMSEDNDYTVAVRVIPAESAKIKQLVATSLDEDVVTVLPLQGEQEGGFTLHSTGVGVTSVKFSLADDDELQATTLVVVRDSSLLTVDEPHASRLSGTEIYRGAQIKLTCATAGATILYTLDGSCPCDTGSASVLTYTGPILATGTELVIKAMAVAKGTGESDVVEFRYKVIDNTVGIEPLTTHHSTLTTPTTYYRLNGQRIARPEKGINIVRQPNGSVQKVMVR